MRAPTAPYTKDEICEALRNAAAENGGSLNYRVYMTSGANPTPKTINRYFGSWGAALRAAGLPSSSSRPSYTDEELLDALRAYLARRGRPPTPQDWRGPPSEPTLRRRFGSFSAALEAAGIRADYRYRNYTDAQLLNILRDRADSSMRLPPRGQMSGPDADVFACHFGTLGRAAELAGVRLNGDYTKRELVDGIRAHHSRTSEWPSKTSWPGPPSASSIRDRFGSWGAALARAGGPARRWAGPNYSDAALLRILKERAGPGGVLPRVGSWDAPRADVYRRRFGSLTQATSLAGVQTHAASAARR